MRARLAGSRGFGFQAEQSEPPGFQRPSVDLIRRVRVHRVERASQASARELEGAARSRQHRHSRQDCERHLQANLKFVGTH